MYTAKLLNLSEFIEEEATVDINGIKIVGFITCCPYQIFKGMSYSVNLSLVFLEGPKITILSHEQYNISRVDDSYSYILEGKVCNDSIDIGNNILIQDDIFSLKSYLNGKFVNLAVDRISIEFI